MIIVGEAVVDDNVGSASFCCDLPSCKGACCTLEGARGAPLEDSEVAEIERAFPFVRQYLPGPSLRTIESAGLVEGHRGDFATRCVGERECVFAYFEEGIARCSFERAYLEGLTHWRKPLSCHLFPIRVRHFGRDFVRYEQIDECSAGRERGEREQVRLYDFLKTPLARKYGDQWYQSFRERCDQDPSGSLSC